MTDDQDKSHLQRAEDWMRQAMDPSVPPAREEREEKEPRRDDEGV